MFQRFNASGLLHSMLYAVPVVPSTITYFDKGTYNFLANTFLIDRACQPRKLPTIVSVFISSRCTPNVSGVRRHAKRGETCPVEGAVGPSVPDRKLLLTIGAWCQSGCVREKLLSVKGWELCLLASLVYIHRSKAMGIARRDKRTHFVTLLEPTAALF